MAEEGANKAAAAAPAAAKGGRGKLILILAVVVLLAGGGGAAWYLGFLGGGAKAEAKADGEHGADKGAGHGEGDEHKPDVGALVEMDPFIANLSDDDGKRYLKAAMEVEFFDPTAPKEFDVRTSQIRDLLLTLLTSKTFAEIRTPEGKSVLRDEIINRINRVMHRDVVKAVYFTEFIVQ